jgi:hypothetical protein
MTEEWRPVVGWEGLYEVSDFGRVRSLDRVTRQKSRWGGSYNTFRKGRILASFPNGQYGYLCVGLHHCGRRLTQNIHSLVARAFLGPCPVNMEVCHGPNGHEDNSPSNLSYGTHTDNLSDRTRDGTELLGERNGNAKADKVIVARVRHLRRSGMTYKNISEQVGLSVSTICQIVTKRTWKHVQ